MKNSLVIILLAAIIGIITGCQSATKPEQQNIINVNARDASQIIESKTPTIIDIRTPNEYSEGHLQNSVNIDYYSADFKTRLSKMDREVPVFVYCKSGMRTRSSLEVFRVLGFKEVYVLSSGLNDWIAAGLPIEK